MDTVCHMRAMASLCRQCAAYHPDRSWQLLAEAEYWEHMASAALLQHSKACTGSPDNLMMQPQQTFNSNHAHRGRVNALRQISGSGAGPFFRPGL